MNKEQMLALPNWAVVGATPKKDRFGYKIWKQMQDAGYTVYGVNPGYEEIDGQKIYADLTEIPGPVDAIDMIVNPKLVSEVLKTAKELGIQNIFSSRALIPTKPSRWRRRWGSPSSTETVCTLL